MYFHVAEIYPPSTLKRFCCCSFFCPTIGRPLVEFPNGWHCAISEVGTNKVYIVLKCVHLYRLCFSIEVLCCEYWTSSQLVTDFKCHSLYRGSFWWWRGSRRSSSDMTAIIFQTYAGHKANVCVSCRYSCIYTYCIYTQQLEGPFYNVFFSSLSWCLGAVVVRLFLDWRARSKKKRSRDPLNPTIIERGTRESQTICGGICLTSSVELMAAPIVSSCKKNTSHWWTDTHTEEEGKKNERVHLLFSC
jgi:hypothetical protein